MEERRATFTRTGLRRPLAVHCLYAPGSGHGRCSGRG